MAKAYFGPGSTGAQNPNPQPTVHATPNPPFYHSDSPFPGEDPVTYGERIEREWYERGMKPLPPEWDVQAPGGAGWAGTGAMAQASPLLFPGALPEGGVQLPTGHLLQGEVGRGGQIKGTLTGPDGAAQTGALGQVSGDQATFNLGGGGQGGAPAGAGGSVNVGTGPGGLGAPSLNLGGGQGDGDALLQEQRDLAFGRLDDVDELYQSRLADLTSQALERQLQGDLVPFTDDMKNRMFAEQADQIAAAQQAQQDRIREGFAARGLGGSGLQLGAELEAASGASQQRGRALNELLVQQHMENFSARERAREGSQAWLANQAAGITPAILEEARMRSRFEVTGDAPGSDLANAIGGLAGALAGGQGSPGSSPAAANLSLPLGPKANPLGGTEASGRVTGGRVGGLTGPTGMQTGGGLQGSDQVLDPNGVLGGGPDGVVGSGPGGVVGAQQQAAAPGANAGGRNLAQANLGQGSTVGPAPQAPATTPLGTPNYALGQGNVPGATPTGQRNPLAAQQQAYSNLFNFGTPSYG